MCFSGFGKFKSKDQTRTPNQTAAMLTPPLSERYSSPLQMVQDTSERVVYKPQSDTASLPEGEGQSELADLMEVRYDLLYYMSILRR